MTAKGWIHTNTKLIYFVLFLISVIFILLFSKSTSPLYVYYTPDSSTFISIGKQILEGKSLYVDCFEHKGPVLFLYQAFAQLIVPGRHGIFIFQIINLFLALIFLFKTSDLVTRSFSKSVFILISFLIYFRFAIGQGNQIEEYSLLFSFISIYLTFKYYYKTQTLSKAELFILSICFSCVFWMNPHNTGVISSCILFIFISHLSKRKLTFSFDMLHIFLVSFTLFSCSICLYFINNKSLEEMIYAVFTFNFKYIFFNLEFSPKSLQDYILSNAIVFITLLIGVVLVFRKERDKNIIMLGILLIMFTFIPVNLRLGVDFYMGLLAPVFVISLLFLLRTKEFSLVQNKTVTISSYALGIALLLSFLINRDTYKNHDAPYIVCAKDIVSQIPINERVRTFGYQVDAKLFVTTDLKPNFKYSYYQESQGHLDNNITCAVNKKIESENTLWVITQNDLMNKSTNTYGKNILTNEYQLFLKDEYFKLYKRRRSVNRALVRFIMLSGPSLFVDNRDHPIQTKNGYN